MAIPQNPEDHIPLDDALNSEADDQQSQKDIHSNGFDEDFGDDQAAQEPDTDLLKQAFNASESAYTLDADKGIAPDQDRKKDGSTK